MKSNYHHLIQVNKSFIHKIYINWSCYIYHLARSAKLSIEYVHDSFVNLEDKEIFLCRISTGELKWFTKHDIPAEVFLQFQKRNISECENNQFCQIDKSNMYSCLFKCKTRGLILAAFDCGIVLGWRDLYGAESLAQIAYMYLDILDAYKG